MIVYYPVIVTRYTSTVGIRFLIQHSAHTATTRALLFHDLVRRSGGRARPPTSMSNNALTYTDSVICYKELIDKEETAKRQWKDKYGKSDLGWRPVEPFEATGASNSKMELPSGMPSAALRNPALYKDTVGGDGLAGGTPYRFGGRWDVLTKNQPIDYSYKGEKPPRVIKKGPHDCYCDIGYNAWSMAGKVSCADFAPESANSTLARHSTPGQLRCC